MIFIDATSYKLRLVSIIGLFVIVAMAVTKIETNREAFLNKNTNNQSFWLAIQPAEIANNKHYIGKQPYLQYKTPLQIENHLKSKFVDVFNDAQLNQMDWLVYTPRSIPYSLINRVLSQFLTMSEMRDDGYYINIFRIQYANMTRNDTDFLLRFQVSLHKNGEIYTTIVSFDSLSTSSSVVIWDVKIDGVVHEQYFKDVPYVHFD